ncbi:DsbA family oxidoreductase [Salinicoccus roseus]|uniref:DsbA family oxidoreductase n=1 Tax=Salinicoccus roseus TaxID=45670 RepID=UPI0035673DC2
MEIEIWSDIGCPFCYIGKRNFEAGLERFESKDEVNVVHKSFRLDPAASTEPDQNMAELLAKKYGKSLEEARQMNRQVSRAAEAAGLEFNMDAVVPSNTMDAHRLIKMAEAEGKDGEALDHLYYAYFTEGRNVARAEVILEIAQTIGMDTTAVEEMLGSNDYKETVISEQNEATRLGAQGVPFFVINRKYGVSGAQPPEAFLEAIEKAHEEEKPLVDLGGDDGASCGRDGCE